MLNQQDLRAKLSSLKGEVKNFLDKFAHKSDKSVYDQADGVVDSRKVESKGDISSRPDIHEFTPDDDKVGTAPKTKSILSDGSNNAQKLVWENEDASMQDKSYSFDEDTTDADYDFEDDLEFEDENDTGSGQESRYS